MGLRAFPRARVIPSPPPLCRSCINRRRIPNPPRPPPPSEQEKKDKKRAASEEAEEKPSAKKQKEVRVSMTRAAPPRRPRRARANSRLTAAATKGAREWTSVFSQYSPPRPRSPSEPRRSPSSPFRRRRRRRRRIHDGYKKSAGEANSLAKTYEDITLNCRDCNAEFVFTSGEQEFYRPRAGRTSPRAVWSARTPKKARFGELRPCATRSRGASAPAALRRFAHRPRRRGEAPQRRAPCYAFSHVATPAARTPRAAAAATPRSPTVPRRATRSRRASAPAATPAASPTTPTLTAPPRSSQPCYAFQKGECSRGDSCRFSHEVTF